MLIRKKQYFEEFNLREHEATGLSRRSVRPASPDAIDRRTALRFALPT
jgi:hypothetical protein